MKEQLKRLRELQAIDQERDALNQNVEYRRAKLKEDESLWSALSADLDQEREQLNETRALHGSKRLELEETEQRLSEAKTKFRGVNNSREYAAAERELESFKKIQGQLEEEVQQLAVAIAEGEQRIADHEEKAEVLRKAIEAEHGEVEVAATEVGTRNGEIDAKAESLRKTLRPDVLARYRFIRQRRPGQPAVVPVKDGACTGCFMRLPPQLYIQLQRQNSLEVCQNCNRILFFVSEEEVVQAES